ncbi:helix-turn-helix transcriptional regulator [Burkholderia arboris]|uniref:helix-turn-helix domain-containing protein n=1 Tax=Burkholderia arboris TaxID=488730 RepID=UPI0030F085A9
MRGALRLRYGIRQKDLAVAMALEQSYVSAIELGTKDPPSQAVVDRLSACLRLSDDELSSLHDARLLSQRHFTIPRTASADICRLCSELWRDLDTLSDVQVPVDGSTHLFGLYLFVPHYYCRRSTFSSGAEHA